MNCLKRTTQSKTRGYNPNKTRMLPNPTKSQTNIISPTTRCKERKRPTDKIRTSLKAKNHQKRLLRLTRNNYGEKRQTLSFCLKRFLMFETVKIVLDAQTVNESCMKERSHMPNMEDLLNQMSPDF